MKLEYDDGAILIDFIARTIENTTPEPLTSIFGEAAGAVDREACEIDRDRDHDAGQPTGLVGGQLVRRRVVAPVTGPCRRAVNGPSGPSPSQCTCRDVVSTTSRSSTRRT